MLGQTITPLPGTLRATTAAPDPGHEPLRDGKRVKRQEPTTEPKSKEAQCKTYSQDFFSSES